MAGLVAEDRRGILKAICEAISAARTPFNLTRADFQAAVDATDAWIDANAAAFNAALPQPARGTLTAKQKAELFMAVARRRFEVA